MSCARGPFCPIVVFLAIVTSLGCVGPFAGGPAGPPGVGEVGQKLETASVALTVTSVERTQRIGAEQRLEQVSRPLEAGEGNTFLVVNLTLENKSQYRLPYQPTQFTVHDGRGVAYNPGVAAGARPLGRGELEPTKDVSGIVNFVVPLDAAEFVLTYRVPNQTYSLSVRLGV